MAMVFITMAFETNMAMNDVNKCKSYDWPNGRTYRFLEELTKWASPSDFMDVLKLKTELSKVQKKRKHDLKVLSSALSGLNMLKFQLIKQN